MRTIWSLMLAWLMFGCTDNAPADTPHTHGPITVLVEVLEETSTRPSTTDPADEHDTDPNLADNDQDGWTVGGGDCNDNNDQIHPGLSEDSPWRCFNDLDDNCNQLVDGEEDACRPFLDLDGDGLSPSQNDCNDNDPNIHPNVSALCNVELDLNCDGTADQDDPNCTWPDADSDGFTMEVDCNDTDPNVSPFALELCDNGIDDDCDGDTDQEDGNCDPGTLTCVRNSSTPDDGIVVAGGDQSEHLASFECYVAGESATLETVGFSNCPGYANEPGCTQIGDMPGIDGVIDGPVEMVLDNGQDAPTAHSAGLNSNVLRFDDLNLLMPADTVVTLDLYGYTADIQSPETVWSGSALQLNLDPVAYPMHVMGVNSGENLGSQISLRTLGRRVTLRNTKPILTEAAGAPDGLTLPGYNEACRFNATADAHHYVEVYAYTVTVLSTDAANSGWNTCGALLGAPSSWEVYDHTHLADPLHDWEDVDVWDVNGRSCLLYPDAVVGFVTTWFDDRPLELPAGSTTPFSVWNETAEASSFDDDVLMVQLQDNDTFTPYDAILWGDGYGIRLGSLEVEDLSFTCGTQRF